MLICRNWSRFGESSALRSLRRLSTAVNTSDSAETSQLATATTKGKGVKSHQKVPFPDDFRFAFPDFLPQTVIQWRHPVREKLERADMLKRRLQIEIPEFYVGSILAVTVADRYAPGRTNRFVGICIQKEHQGLRHAFILRNVVDNMGVEIKYDLYNPLILKMEVLKLEKRVDEHLLYLRDAMPEYSTIPFNFEAVPHPTGAAIPVNHVKVQMKPQPWTQRWEIKEMLGIADFQHLLLPINLKRMKNTKYFHHDKFDLMKSYRSEIPAEDQKEIFDEMLSFQKEMVGSGKRKRLFSHRKLQFSRDEK